MDTPRAGMERCWMQPEDISCFQVYNSWCWLMEKQDLSREGEGTAWGHPEPLGGSSLATKSCPALSITISSALPHPQFPAPGSSQGVHVHPSIIPRANVPSFAGLCLVYLSNQWLSSVLVWFSKFLSYPPCPKCGAMDGAPEQRSRDGVMLP